MNRLDFIKKALLGAGAMVFAPTLLFGNKAKNLPIKTITGQKGYADFKISDKIIIPAELQVLAHEFSLGFKKLSHGYGIPSTYIKGNYRIDYHTKLRDDRTRHYLKTFARVSQQTGRIDINKMALDRMKATEHFVFYGIIWCYVKYKAVKERYPISDTYTDLATMRYYQHTNRPIKDILIGLCKQFKESPSQNNINRYRTISEYIATCEHTFDKQKFDKLM